jgi:phosphoenolpyruvate synthase/pyruvate phosphate dikinase
MSEHIIRSTDRPGTAFATTPAAYREFVRSARLRPVIAGELRRYRRGRNVVAVGAAIRTAFAWAPFPAELAEELLTAYAELGGDGTLVAIGNEGANGLPATAWRPESFGNVGNGRDLLAAVKRCYAATFSARAIAFRAEHGLDQLLVAPTVGVRPMDVLIASPRQVDVTRGARRIGRTHIGVTAAPAGSRPAF